MSSSDQRHTTASRSSDSEGFDSMVSPSSTRRSRMYSEEDEEIRRAKAMALAISQNPNVSNPEDIKALVEKQQQQETTKRSSMLIPQRLAQALGGTGDAAPSNHNNASPTAATKRAAPALVKTFQDSFRVNRKRTDSKEGPSPTSTSSTNNNTGSGNNNEQGKQQVTSPIRNLLSNSSRGASAGSNNAAIMPSPSLEEDTASNTSSGRRQHRRSISAGAAVESPESPAAAAVTDEPIKLSATAWKRRSGLGKLSATKAWERRRIVLQGSKIIYFYHKEHDGDVVNDALLDEVTNPPSENNSKEKKQTWLEQAAERARALNYLPTEDPSIPRGSLDMVKERATVAAASGHSGAPTPFALSIKVKGDTYWKLCFDTHREQMDWLAALTDLVVQCSVDAYNAQLLAAADPMNPHHDAGVLFHASAHVMPPPPQKPTDEHEGGHRLWMTSDYNVSSSYLGDGGGEEKVERKRTAQGSPVAAATEEESSVTALSLSTPASIEPGAGSSFADVWTIREKDVYAMVIIVNVALVYSHASSTSSQGFWYVITFANLGLWFCLLNEEEKRKKEKNKTRPVKVVTTLAEDVEEEEKQAANSPAPHEDGNPARRSIRVGRSSRRGMRKKKSVAKTKAVLEKPAIPGFKPLAGTTTIPIENASDLPVNTKNEVFAGWRCLPGNVFQVRSHGYLTTKKKIPSPGELYECLYCDIFESPSRYPDMAPRVHLPKVEFDGDGGPKTWRAPDIFVVSISLPTDPPKLRGSSDDGGGYTITLYMTMKKETRDILRRVTADNYNPSSEATPDDPQKSKVNAVKLFEEWCRRAPTDDAFFARFKLIVTCQNLKEIGIPSWIGKYNGKPVLIKRPGTTGFLYPHPELSTVEFDISFHPFPYLAKQAICYLKENFFKKVLVTFGFCIEGRSDDELPECVIGTMQLCYPDPTIAIQGPEFFAGTSRKSFEEKPEPISR